VLLGYALGSPPQAGQFYVKKTAYRILVNFLA